MFGALKYLVNVHCGISVKRKDMIKPRLDGNYAKAVSRAKEGSPEWLYGGELEAVMKRCDNAMRLAEKIVAKKEARRGCRGANH